MSAAAGARMECPAHPGGFVKHEIIEPQGLSVTDAARILGVTRPALSALLDERATLSPEPPYAAKKAFGVSMNTLLRPRPSAKAGRRDRCRPFRRQPQPSFT